MSSHEFCFIRQEGLGNIAALVVLRIVTTKDSTRDGALDSLQTGCTEWAKATLSGRNAWDDSAEDFNVGDLILHLDNEALKGCLHVEGIESVGVVYEFYEGQAVSFDRVLIDAEAIEDVPGG